MSEDVSETLDLDKSRKSHQSMCTIFNSYTMGMSGLPDIYTLSPRAAGPRAEGVYIR